MAGEKSRIQNCELKSGAGAGNSEFLIPNSEFGLKCGNALLPRLLPRTRRPRQPDLSEQQTSPKSSAASTPSPATSPRPFTTRSSTPRSASPRPASLRPQSSPRTSSARSTSPSSTNSRSSMTASASTSGKSSTPPKPNPSVSCASIRALDWVGTASSAVSG